MLVYCARDVIKVPAGRQDKWTFQQSRKRAGFTLRGDE